MVETDADEDSETKFRRRLGQKAGELYRRAHLSNWPEFVKNFQYRRASRMFARARLVEIAPLRAQFRSPALQPPPFLPNPTREKCSEIVGGGVALRADKLCKAERSPTTSIAGIADGRLLLFIPEETLTDSTASYASKGFFDIDNVPPWDTWVCFYEQYVVSWVPPQLVELANSGVDANPEQCISWA